MLVSVANGGHLREARSALSMTETAAGISIRAGSFKIEVMVIKEIAGLELPRHQRRG
ncbi:MAG: hypothetical protein WBZ07_02945 [Candidatus Dormiibacterota bacterium]